MSGTALQTGDAKMDAGSVKSACPSNPVSMTRKTRWKRRGISDLRKRLIIGSVLVVLCLLVVLIVRSGSRDTAAMGPDGPFASALAQAFPEADVSRIETRYDPDGEMPLGATLHLPAHLLESSQAFVDPFARLGSEFGGAERTLSGVELGARLERVANEMLPADLPRCHTYDIGQLSPQSDDAARTRALHIHLNPGC